MRRTAFIFYLLTLLTLALYWPVNRFEFVDYDDKAYVTENPFVTRGFTWEGVLYAFTGTVLHYWQPLTVLSHMLDCQLFGLNSTAHHLVNLLFHLANTLLLFFVLRQMTGREWPSAFVAALFAWHPLHVESVAWVAERKDLLSTFFWTLAIWGYARYAQADRKRMLFYGLSLLFFALGLLAKSMIVTLPFLLLLLDVWPLRRWPEPPPADAQRGALARFVAWLASGRGLLLEKLPFLALTVAASVKTFLLQKVGGSMISPESLTLGDRVANSLVSYVRYLGKMVWPEGLVVFYPHPGHWAVWQVAGAALLLAAVTALAVWQWRARPYLAVGWFWFLGTLVPVIGVVQAGWQSLADHFTYVPLTGIFIMLAWGMADLAASRRRYKPHLSLAAVLVMAACLVTTRMQLRHWQNSYTLFLHAVKEYPQTSAVGHMGLGNALLRMGKTEEALALLREAVRIQPYYTDALNNLGNALFLNGKTDEALTVLSRAVEISPDNPDAHFYFAQALAQAGRFDEALSHYQRALELDPLMMEARNNLANLLAAGGKIEEAVAHYNRVLALKPDSAQVHFNLAGTLARQGKLDPALEHYRKVVSLAPKDEQARAALGLLLMRKGEVDAAIGHFAEWTRIQPDNPKAHHFLGAALLSRGRSAEAIGPLREALRLKPDQVETLLALAHVLATDVDVRVRDSAQAVSLAERAAELTERKQFVAMDILSLAYASAGKSAKAIEAGQAAHDLAKAAGQEQLAAAIQNRLQAYKAGRSSPPSPPP